MAQPTFISKVISAGRVTIPKDIRKEHCIKDGDYVQITIGKFIVAEAKEGI